MRMTSVKLAPLKEVGNNRKGLPTLRILRALEVMKRILKSIKSRVKG